MNWQTTGSMIRSLWERVRTAVSTYHAEQYGMAMVIGISTYHVMSQMTTVEGYWWVAGTMGAALGFFNATFAFRFFEATSSEKRAPALAGMVASVLVSIFIQYGFYTHAEGLEPWHWLGSAGPDFHALLYGAWAPCFELLLGWSFGVRIRVQHGNEHWRDQITANFTDQLDALRAKLAKALQDAQAERDKLTQLKQRSAGDIERVQAEQTRLFNVERTQLIEQLNTLRAEHAHAVQALERTTEQLNALRAEQAHLTGRLEGMEGATPRRPRRSKPAKTQGDETRDEKLRKVLAFYEENPGGSIRLANERTGYSQGSLVTYIDLLVQQNRLNKTPDGKVYPATVQRNGVHPVAMNGN